MKVLDLFSGIGGFSLGFDRAGMETVAFCEFDEHARRVLAKNWPNITIHKDVRELDGKQYRGTVDVICGGYPCQPFSVAGKQRGAEDDRHLWPEYFRLIREVGPTWVVAENVTGHIKLGLDEVLSDLESEGYAVETFIIPACALNAHHRRNRVWIVGYSDSARRRKGNKEVAGEKPKQSDSLYIQPGEANTNASNFGLQGRSEEPFSGVSHLQSKLIRSGETIGIVPNPGEPSISGITDGVSKWVDGTGRRRSQRAERIKRLGNAVVPQIPEAIGRAIMEVENGSTVDD